jgi:hypothetical protein
VNPTALGRTARLVAGLAGLYLMAAPALLGYGGALRIGQLILGPITVAVAIVAMSAVTAGVRWLHVPIGVILVVLAVVLAGPVDARVGGAVAGLVIALAGLVPSDVDERFAGGWRVLLDDRP